MTSITIVSNRLAKTTPFELGVAEFDGETWQILVPLTSESTQPSPFAGSFSVNWEAETAGSESWLFLNLTEENGSMWSFGFDRNEPEVSVFLSRLLREKRLMVSFPNQNGIQLEKAADRLKETLRTDAKKFIPHSYTTATQNKLTENC